MENADDIFVCPFEAFLQDYGPAVNDDDTVQACIENPVVRWVLDAYKGDIHKMDGVNVRPSSLNAARRSQTRLCDPTQFRKFHLINLIHAIWGIASNISDRRNQYCFTSMPDCKGHKNEISPAVNDFFMDAHIYDPVQHDIIVPVVIEKQAMKEKGKVNDQVIHDCTRLMNDDPRRVFIYAVTVEGLQVTIWYFSRTHSVRTTSFNWAENDVVRLVRVILAFACTRPEDMGLDPRVHKALRSSQDEDQQFVYEYANDHPVELEPTCGVTLAFGGTLPDSEFASTSALQIQRTCNDDKIFFKTIELLGLSPSFFVTGRTTRVWLVKQVTSSTGDSEVDNAVPMVLKDVWIKTDSRTEVENLEAMFHFLDSFVAHGLAKYAHAGPDALKHFLEEDPKFRCFNEATRDRLKYFLTAKNYRTLFLTTIHAWKGQTSKPLSSRAQMPDSIPDAMDEKKTSSKSKVKVMIQHRFVYKEVCTPCHELPTFGDVMDVLRQSLDALQVLYCAGWVHRDISSGNILAMGPFIENGRQRYQVKLSDFEFAQPMNRDKHRPDLCTGTTLYMPVEIMGRKHLLENIRKSLTELDGGGVVGLDDVDTLSATFVGNRICMTKRAASDTSKSHWGINSDHPLFFKLRVFKECPDLLPIPDNATLEIPDYNDTANYNYQHDLESIWWIILYFVTSLANCEPSKNYARSWFLDDLDLINSINRKHCLANFIYTLQFETVLRPEFRQVFPTIIEILRDALYNQYIARAVYGLLTDDSSYGFIHGLFAQSLDVVLQTANLSNWAQVAVEEIPGQGTSSLST